MNVALLTTRRLVVRSGGIATKALAGNSVRCLSTKPHKYSLETREDFDWDDYDHRAVAPKIVFNNDHQQLEQQQHDVDDFDHRPKQQRPIQEELEEGKEEPIATIEEALMEGQSMYHRAMRFNLELTPPAAAEAATLEEGEGGDIDDYDHRSLTTAMHLRHPQLKLQKEFPTPSPPPSAQEVEAWMDDIDDYDHRIHYYCCQQQHHNCPKKTTRPLLFHGGNPMMEDIDDYDRRVAKQNLVKEQDRYIRQHAWE